MAYLIDNIADLNILYLTPYVRSRRGNAATAKRMEHYLTKAGANVEVFAFEEEQKDAANLIAKADIIHALHVRRTAEWLSNNNLKPEKPLLITSGGTDINIDLEDSRKRKTMEELLKKAGALTVFTEDASEKIINSFPFLERKMFVIPQSVVPRPFQRRSLIESGQCKILLPAGLREVKDVLFLKAAWEQLGKEYPHLEVILLGEKLNNTIFEQVKELENQNRWFTYAGAVPPSQMSEWYEEADFVVNTSVSEGQPISILEAMSHSIPVIVRNNPGNASVVDSCTNVLFETPDQFLSHIRFFLKNPNEYERYSQRVWEHVMKHHLPSQEMNKYARVYEQLLQKSACAAPAHHKF
ncbi:glycosyltransferase [Alteribacillus sp. HJP-4]|uniref:glycosyltransferase n=1 Tax=Alteribacillus sp. HJP-4 TaxID=2775394 RepID=UPI0035CD18EE